MAEGLAASSGKNIVGVVGMAHMEGTYIYTYMDVYMYMYLLVY